MSEFLADVLEGLSGTPKALPCKYLYDELGSELFEKICETEDYYVTRADLELHHAYLSDICQKIGPQAHVIEFGSGAGIKTRLLLKTLDRPRGYTPIEISATALEASVSQLRREFKELEIIPLRADYTEQIDSEALKLVPPAQKRVVYFPGSTIGNFSHQEAILFLERMAKIALSSGAVLIGVDLLKPISKLLQAYDDSQGVTAQFNKNLLIRVKRELNAEVDLDAFVHEARFNEALSRVEMHLLATKETYIRVGGQSFHLAEGETIHTESSHKYSIESFQSLATKAGLMPVKHWVDDEHLFSMHYLQPQKN